MKTSQFLAHVATVILLTLATLSFINATFADTVSYEITPRSTKAISWDLRRGQTFSAFFLVTAAHDDTIEFMINDPEQRTVVDLGRVHKGSFNFTAQMDGNYSVSFGNTFSSSTKLVSFSYELYDDRYLVFGIEPWILIVITLAVGALILASVFHFLRLRRRKTTREAKNSLRRRKQCVRWKIVPQNSYSSQAR